MKFIPTEIPDVWVIEPKVFEDSRGYFYESYRASAFAAQGIKEDFQQDNHVSSKKGALRGLHFQTAPHEQAKLIRVTRGSIFDVAVDIRKASRTFGRHVGVELTADNRRMIYIPAGFAHGYLALEDGTEVLYKVTNTYSPSHERGIIWNDPALGIAWPKLNVPYAFSDKDQKYPVLKQAQLA